jgi:hypothetical protein
VARPVFISGVLTVPKVRGWDETGTSFRYRLKDPGSFVQDTYRTIDITDGVKATSAKKTADGPMELQALIFDKATFDTLAKAKKWLADHKDLKKEAMKKNGIQEQEEPGESETGEDISLDDRMMAVRKAINAKFNDPAPPGAGYCYAEVVYEDRVILCRDNKLWEIAYTLDDDGTVAFTGEPVEVRKTFVPVNEGVIIGPLGDDGHFREAGAALSGKKWGVLIIQEGMSKNRNRYGKRVLQEAAPLYEGARIFMDHEEAPRRFGRSVRDQAGFLKDVKTVSLGGGKEGLEPVLALAGTAVVTKEAVRKEMLEAWEEGNPNLWGLSHDALCESVTCMAADGPFYDVTRIESVRSVDFVTNPAAGGRVLRLVASDTVPHTLEGDGRMLQKMIEAIKASGNAAMVAKLEALGTTPTEDQVLGIYQEALKTPAPQAAAPAAPAKAPTPDPPAAPVQEATIQVRATDFMETVRDGRTSFLEATLTGCSLPDLVKDQLRGRFTQAITDAKTPDVVPAKAAIMAAVKEQVDLFAKLADQKVILPASGRPRAEVVKDHRDKVTEALDAFFDPKKPARSFRQLYIDITGDVNVTGLVKEATRLTEALNTASFGEILGDSITRRMVADYQMADQAVWRGTIAEVVPVTDFRTQRRMRFGGYGNLPIVGQGGPYTALTSPTDEEATYAPAKRGGTEQITIEMIANDDVGAIRRIPARLARAAAQTLYEFVFDFMALNPNIYDGSALAVAGHGSNLITTALTSSNLSSARLKMRQQTDMSNGKRIGLVARYLWVPGDLEELGFQLTTSDRAMPDASITTTAMPAAPNYIRKVGIESRTVDYWSDANNYWVTADITQTPMIEIGFWGGREEPELFVQDVPNQGSLFSNDVITYKIRHVYGGAVLDFRGFVGGIVA